MIRFDYQRASTVEDAVRMLAATPGAKALAGGTNLIDLMKYNVAAPTQLIDINRLPLHDIEETQAGGLRLGALVSNSDTAYHPAVVERFPLLSHAILSGATGQLRNAATNGGNLLQRTRCFYFYDVQTPCNKRESGTGCPARDGLNRSLGILGTSEHCIATHPSDMCVALAALGADVVVQGTAGVRRIPMADFHRLPGDHPEKDNVLAPDELILSIEIPPQSYGPHWTYLKLRDRQSYAFALISAAAALEMDGTTVRQCRLALGGVAHKPWRNTAAEALLEGKEATLDNFKLVADALLQGARGYGGNDFKIPLARRVILRALKQAAAGTPQPIEEKRFV